MDLMGAYVDGLALMFQPATFVGICLGVTVGLIAGAVPGLGSLVVLPLFLPFMHGLSPEIGLPFLVSIISVGFIGGSISAVLLNVPGTGPNVMTCLDGYPMTQRGEGARALGASRMASLLGSFMTTIWAILIIPLLLPIVLAMRSAEMVVIILMGLSFLIVLSKASLTTGLISAVLGFLVSSIGFHSVTGEVRFSFGLPLLYDGLPLVPVVLGLFALTEMIELATKRSSIAAPESIRNMTLRMAWEGYKDVWRYKWLSLRSSGIGFVTGLIPGMGGDVATFISYGQAKQLSKNPDAFGTGAVEGVIAAESANDAKEGGALLTTLAFGIPGSAIWAIMLGALLTMGLTPGPRMFEEQLGLSIGMLYVIAFASLIATVVTTLAIPVLGRVTVLPSHQVVAVVVPIVFIGAYAANEDLSDIVLLIVFTALGLTMKRLGYNRPAFLLAFILGFLFELELFKALNAYGVLFFLRPISLGLLAITVGLFVYAVLPRRKKEVEKV